MKFLLILLIPVLVACEYSWQTGPDPHSISFEEQKFEKIISYFIDHPNTENFKTEDAPSNIPVYVLSEMEDVGFLEYRNLGEYKVFFCGYGVVGKGWGFIYGEFTEKQILQPGLIEGNNKRIYLSHLEALKGKWYRFGAG